ATATRAPSRSASRSSASSACAAAAPEMRSMTGFGAGAASLGAGRYFAEARSVNHRFLDLRVQLPDELEEHQFAIEQAARARLERGRVDLRFRSELDAVGSLELDVARARKAFEAL